MTPEDKEFVRDLYENAPLTEREVKLLALLIESEGMRMKAEWQQSHSETAMHRLSCIEGNKEGWEGHDWTDADWIAAARKELVGDG